MTIANRQLPVETPDPVERMLFDDPAEAVERLGNILGELGLGR